MTLPSSCLPRLLDPEDELQSFKNLLTIH